jgi:hypothetical protein
MSDALPPETGRSAHVRPALRAALTSLVHEGLTITEAASRAGLQRESLSKALKKPHVQAVLSDLKRAWATNETAKAWLVVARLAENAVSEDTRLRACRTLLEAAGELSGKSDAPPPVGTAIQIIIGTGPDRREVRLSDGQVSGVIEAEPYSPALATALPDGGDD